MWWLEYREVQFIILIACRSLLTIKLTVTFCVSIKSLIHEWWLAISCSIHNRLTFIVATLDPFCYIYCISKLLIFISYYRPFCLIFIISTDWHIPIYVRFLNLFEVLLCNWVQVSKKLTVANIETIISASSSVLWFTLWLITKLETIHGSLIQDRLLCQVSYLLTITSEIHSSLL